MTKTHQKPTIYLKLTRRTAMARNTSTNGIREIVLDDGTKRFEARVHRSGEPAKSKRFKTRTEALKWKRQLDSAIDVGRPARDRKTVLIRDIIDDYLAYKNASLKPLPSNKVTDYQRVRDDLAEWSISKLTNIDVENYVRLLLGEPIKRDAKKEDAKRPKRTYKPATVRKFYYALKKAVEWHSKTYKYHVDEHLFSFEKGTIPDGWSGKRERRLKADEERRLYAAGLDREHTFTEADWRAIIGFALETAMREQEIVGVQWKCLANDDRKLNIPGELTKTGRPRVVLLSLRAREIVAEQRANCPPGEARIFHQFPTPDSVCVSFARLCKRAKVSNLTFHDLRHEATSRLCESGKLNMMQIMEMTGHSSMTTFQGYLHLLKHETSVVLD
ncbi:site-specific integrase [Aromatoleum toluolicum]|uniref:Tyrosine-type recombinase/integrase n=1 Tax=Aromatoleum toluolicum TaxID=90060 RepID=A0ABX1NA22_9RHOO|nr:site-specific integrase [Aromatoleum toluolicum]NMF96141.1 site-specific integrase [Aromatoleum toluolicum]